MANRGEISQATVKEWDHATKGKRLPEKVSSAFARGAADAFLMFGLKTAAEEIRLKIPLRQFHGWDAAFKAEKERGGKRAGCGTDTANDLAAALADLSAPRTPAEQATSRDSLDRSTAWGAPSHLGAGDTASRMSDMGQPTSIGAVF